MRASRCRNVRPVKSASDGNNPDSWRVMSASTATAAGEFFNYAWPLELADLREMQFDLSLIEFADRVPAKTKNQDG